MNLCTKSFLVTLFALCVSVSMFLLMGCNSNEKQKVSTSLTKTLPKLNVEIRGEGAYITVPAGVSVKFRIYFTQPPEQFVAIDESPNGNVSHVYNHSNYSSGQGEAPSYSPGLRNIDVVYVVFSKHKNNPGGDFPWIPNNVRNESTQLSYPWLGSKDNLLAMIGIDNQRGGNFTDQQVAVEYVQ